MWEVIEVNNQVHVVPERDLREHKLDSTCDCGLTIDDEGVYIHYSYDNREVDEERGPSRLHLKDSSFLHCHLDIKIQPSFHFWFPFFLLYGSRI